MAAGLHKSLIKNELDVIRECWIEYIYIYIYIGILESWTTDFGWDPGPYKPLIKVHSIEYNSREILDAWFWNGF